MGEVPIPKGRRNEEGGLSEGCRYRIAAEKKTQKNVRIGVGARWRVEE
jgi:hypothetical protein